MSQEGWISLYRQIRESWIWDDRPFDKTHAWLDLLLSANHQENKTKIGNEIILVPRGSFVTSELKLMDRWGWSKTKLRSFLKLLEDDNMIVKKSDKKKTTITIVNYSVYQESENHKKTAERPQKDHEETTEKPKKDTNNNDNNVNNDNKNIINMSAEQTPYEQIKEIFIKNCPTLPVIKTIAGDRQKKVKVRWKEHPDLAFFENLFKKANESDFLSGRNGKWTNCCFDWILMPSNMQKILEGNYDNKESKGNTNDWLKEE